MTVNRNYGDSLNITEEIDYIYQRFYINLNLTLGIRHTFSDVFGISLAIRGSLSLLESENRGVESNLGFNHLWRNSPKYVGGDLRLQSPSHLSDTYGA